MSSGPANSAAGTWRAKAGSKARASPRFLSDSAGGNGGAYEFDGDYIFADGAEVKLRWVDEGLIVLSQS